MREVVIDTETTGLNFKAGDRVIEVACVELVNHINTGKYLQFYCSTKKVIDDKVTKVHGLTNDFLNKFPTFSEQAIKFLEFIKTDTLIIHNADFDLGFINNELEISKLKPLENSFIDTMLLARQKLNTRTVNLDSLCKKFSIDLSARKIHGALLDCRLLSEVYLELLGGQQASLELAKSSHTTTSSKNINTTNENKICQVRVSSEEIRQHKEFVTNLKNSLWHKINY